MRRKMGTRKKASAGSNVTQLNKQIPLYQRKKWYRGGFFAKLTMYNFCQMIAQPAESLVSNSAGWFLFLFGAN